MSSSTSHQNASGTKRCRLVALRTSEGGVSVLWTVRSITTVRISVEWRVNLVILSIRDDAVCHCQRKATAKMRAESVLARGGRRSLILSGCGWIQPATVRTYHCLRRGSKAPRSNGQSTVGFSDKDAKKDRTRRLLSFPRSFGPLPSV